MASSLFSSRLNIARTSLYLALLLCTIVVLGVDAHALSAAGDLVGGVLAYIIFLTVWTFLLVVPLVFVLPFVKPDSILTYTKFELGVLGMLWAMWLGGAAAATSDLSYSLSYCGNAYVDYWGDILGYVSCAQPRALLAFSWISWLILTALFFGLGTLAFIEHGKGHRDVWNAPTTEYPYGNTSKVATTDTKTPETGAPASETTEANKEQVTPVSIV